MFLDIGGQRLFFTATSFLESVTPRTPVILGLHGGPGIDGSQMRYFLQPAAHWAQVIVPDQRGHGYSDHSAPESWNLKQWAQDTKEFIDRLGLTEVILVGTSFGGFVVQQFLAEFPGTVRGAVVVGASPRKASDDEIVERYREVGGDRAAEVMRRSLHDSSKEAEAEWAEVCAPLASVRPPDATLQSIRRSRVNTPEVNRVFVQFLPRMDLRTDLRHATDPILVLVGENDPLTPPKFAAEIRAAASSADVWVEIVPGASHQVLWDEPEATDRLLREFTERTTTGPPQPAAT